MKCSELWISKHFPSIQTLPQLQALLINDCSVTPTTWKAKEAFKAANTQKKESEAKLHIFPELKHALLWGPLATAVSGYQMQSLTPCEVSRACACFLTPSECVVPYAVSLLPVNYTISIIITAEHFLKGRLLVSSFQC